MGVLLHSMQWRCVWISRHAAPSPPHCTTRNSQPINGQSTNFVISYKRTRQLNNYLLVKYWGDTGDTDQKSGIIPSVLKTWINCVKTDLVRISGWLPKATVVTATRHKRTLNVNKQMRSTSAVTGHRRLTMQLQCTVYHIDWHLLRHSNLSNTHLTRGPPLR